MKESDPQLERLLRAAALAGAALPNGMPFGFDTRVLAGWRSAQKRDLVDLRPLLRRVVLVSLGVIVLGATGVYNELRQNDEMGDPLTDEYAIADSAIGSVFAP
ncbi:MAG: hypothetical protein H0T83_09175 [Chthoniobacterales bacterium]|nr:hypothetical protein [Chthoniobacterales bacterium]